MLQSDCDDRSVWKIDFDFLINTTVLCEVFALCICKFFEAFLISCEDMVFISSLLGDLVSLHLISCLETCLLGFSKLLYCRSLGFSMNKFVI